MLRDPGGQLALELRLSLSREAGKELDALLEADAASKIRGTILRLPDFYGPGVERSLLHSLFQAAGRGGTANLIGRIDTPQYR